jgi:hypothetical protein
MPAARYCKLDDRGRSFDSERNVPLSHALLV